MKKLSTTALIAAALLAGACEKKEEETTPAAEEETYSTSTLTTGSAVMGTITNSLASLGTAAPGTLVIQTGVGLDSSGSGNPLCSEHGQPLNPDLDIGQGDPIPDGSFLSQDDPNYAANLFFCLATLTPEEGASVETILGSLAQAQSILCSFEEAFGTISYTTEGTNLLAGGPTEATLSETCWPNGAPDGITSITFTEGVATALDESTGYEKKLTFSGEVEGGEVSQELLFFNKDGVIGFKTMGAGNAPAVGDASQVTFDTNTGAIVVNVIDDRGGFGGADSSYRRIVRMKVKGTLDADLNFTGIESMQGIYANSGFVFEEDTAMDASSSIVSLKGNATDGFYGVARQYNSSTGSEVYAGCTGANDECTGEGLAITDALNTSFYGSASRSAWGTHIESGLPPCDDGNDLTFDAVPTTGAFGVCE